jgi:hypothetical protein
MVYLMVIIFIIHTNSNPPYTINGVADFAMNLLGSAVDQIELLRKKPDFCAQL